MGGRYLYNKLGKKELRKRIEAEDFDRTTLSFYRYVRVEDPQELRNRLFLEWEELQVNGRIYVANEGINAQLSVPAHRLEEFRHSVDGFPEFKDVPFKIAVEEPNDSFLKLTIKVRRKLVADGLPDEAFDVSNVGEHLSAEAFNSLIEQGATVVDMRNNYECEIGHFENAYLPESEKFEDALPEVLEQLKGKEEEPVVLYCTGGIRCEKASAWLRHHGFNNVGQLHGGIIDYAHQVKRYNLKNRFHGLNFVFDERLAERIDDEVISTCHQCGTKADNIRNCKNKTCNMLLIQCESCASKYADCCTPACREVVLLPEELQQSYRKGKGSRSSKEKMVRDSQALQALIAAQEEELRRNGTLLPELNQRTN
jgi:UPF0176 protein